LFSLFVHYRKSLLCSRKSFFKTDMKLFYHNSATMSTAHME
jgi:hypothetical protein